MTTKWFFGVIMLAFLMAHPLTWDSPAWGEGSSAADPELSKKMFRSGKEAYERGKYGDAKAYFKRAVQADPDAVKAWRYYDLAVVADLTQKVEKNLGKADDLLAPDESVRQGAPKTFVRGFRGPPPVDARAKGYRGPPPPESGPQKSAKPKVEFKIVEDEGC
ncbi:MAG: hypothetical protein K9L83_06630 [Deltaproteobacteria bacterium]|nr:hypothetical protein [Deltaproteobacteria bacterium]